MGLCNECSKDGEYIDSGVFFYGRLKSVGSPEWVPTGYKVTKRFEVLGQQVIRFCTECLKDMMRKRWRRLFTGIASFILPLLAVSQGWSLIEGRAGEHALAWGVFIWLAAPQWVIWKSLLELEGLRGKLEHTSLFNRTQLLDKETIRRCRRANPAEYRGVIHWTQQEYQQLGR